MKDWTKSVPYCKGTGPAFLPEIKWAELGRMEFPPKAWGFYKQQLLLAVSGQSDTF